MKKIVTTTYQCDICKNEHDSEEKAIKCEKEHNIINIKWFWYIPGMGILLLIYNNIRYKSPVIDTTNLPKWHSDYIMTSPFLLVMIIVVIMMLTLSF